MRALAFVCVCLSVSGCGMFSREPSFPWSKDDLPCSDSPNQIRDCTKNDVLKAYTLARSYCHQLASNHEDGGDLINSSTFAIASIGTLAGAVFSPLAEGSAKTAWSGVSGSANALQTAMNTSFSNAVNARRRDEIGKAGVEYKTQVTGVDDPRKQVFAAMDMAYDCKMAVGRADAAVVRAISELQAGAVARQVDLAASAQPVIAQMDAEKAAKSDALTAAEKIVKSMGGEPTSKTHILANQIAEAAASAAAPVAASVATTTVLEAAAVEGEVPSLVQTQTAAKVAAQAAAGEVARKAAQQKAVSLMSGQTQEVKSALEKIAVPIAETAAKAAAEAAATNVAAPAQP